MDEVNKFLGEFGQNTDGLEEQPIVSEVEGQIAPEIEPEVQEEKIPFHKIKEDPKFQRFLDKEIDRRMKDFQPTRQEQFKEELTNDGSKYLSYAERILGTDTEENKAKSQVLAQIFSEIENKATETSYNRFAEESKAERQAEIESVNQLQDGLDRIEENFGVDLSSNSATAKKTRNDFLDFVGRISPKNEYGEIKEYADLESAFETFKEMRKPETNTQAKQIASRGMQSSAVSSAGTVTRRITAGNLRSVMGLE